MSLPGQFKEENYENILIYHYVEELVSDFSNYSIEHFNDDDITLTELPFLLRIRFVDKSTQKDLVRLFKVSDGYTAKLLKRFEDKGFITRHEDPENRRRKIVRLTDKGCEKTDEILDYINSWEEQRRTKLSDEEFKTLKKLLFKYLI
ncbi:MAG: winged helix-turn-helix transcriptional regulator [Methanobrevibacter sp.]|nr:winged helix-turn-helix transcriptional regulator [Methanobrevibacter sp.]